ncbi:PTS sugar transporter subunit IIB [Caldifermentibacillus hisashii]|uniref:PTS sugar transporter subunit IIB n=1 Tax=Caldifermentibacillus hisashii TaxID=996558 RepID=UPI003BEF2115
MSQIVIIDNQTAEDNYLTSIFNMIAPKGIKLKFFNNKDELDYLLNITESKDRIIVLAKAPETFIYLLVGGLKLKEIVIGGMDA